MAQYIDTAPKQETAALVAVTTPQQSGTRTKEHVEELAFLAFTLGIKTLDIFTQNLATPNAKTVVGKGKLEEIAFFVKEQQVDLVIFDDELSPSQVRNLEGALHCKVIDRNLLILNIFAMRAKTNQAKTQVELAQYKYVLPRLTRMWAHLSRQKGGSAGMRGPGNKELETDRRIAQDRIAHLHRKLEAIERQSVTQRKTRARITRVALAGYTNVGKSTLMRVLSKSNVHVEDKLFATIDSTVRKVAIHGIPFLLTDTVGFIRKLPHTLVECFKSTLNEIKEADIILHVVDISHPAHREHIEVVQKTLQEIGVLEVPTILVFNKIDQLNTNEGTKEAAAEAASLQQTSLLQKNDSAVYISAQQQENIEVLKEVLYQQVYLQHMKIYPNYLKEEAYQANFAFS
ncbi:MAG: GTPase HflX [Amoebophilaceae bacterium]|jgi:GTP-binding protein HflX|nr:GTPase HflX [Amoebophilaceae bacterium]